MIEAVTFCFFAALSLLMVGICAYCYSGKSGYQEGMILGIHVPKEAGKDEKVLSLTAHYRKCFRRFQWINAGAGLAASAVVFLSIGISVLFWTLWCLEYMIGLMILNIRGQRRMYTIKMEYGWFMSERHPDNAVDTAVSAKASAFPVRWQWHLPAVFIGFAVWIIPQLRERLTADRGLWILPAVGALLPLIFLWLHFCLAGQKNVVYSKDSSINESMSRLEKRTWSEAILAADYASLTANIYICLRLIFGGQTYFWDYVIYCAIDMVGAAAVIAGMMYIIRQRKNILKDDTQPIMLDDDDYWKNGWYSNPNDTHLWVQNRMCSTNYTMNMAHPAAKWWVSIAGILCAAAIAGVVIISGMLIQMEHAATQMEVSGHSVTLSHGFYQCSFQIEDIQTIGLEKSLPGEHFKRTNGAATDRQLAGYFEGDETGAAMMFIHRDVPLIIQIELPDQTVFFNGSTRGLTEAWYAKLTGMYTDH